MARYISEQGKKKSTSIALSPYIRQLSDYIMAEETRPNIANLFEYLLLKYAKEKGYLKLFKPSDVKG